MKILLDPQIFFLQKYGGISRYYTELFSILSKKNNFKLIVPLYSTTNIYYKQSILVTFKQKTYSFYIRTLSKLRIRHKENTIVRNEIYLKNLICKKEYDLFIPTYYNPYFLEYIDSKPFVLTIYDMIHELFPEYFINDRLNVVMNKKYLMEKATRIIAVSNNTKNDIIKIYPHIDSSKIDVVYHGCSIKFSNKIIDSLPLNYILFVGKRENYKNFIFLVNSIADLLIHNSNLYLICAGGGEFNTKENQLVCKFGLENQIIQKNFEEDELSIYYKNAKCFVFPSLYEGFGIPVLESMTCGCPVVLANHSSFPEVAGDAGVYYELNNSKDLKDKIEMVVKDESLRNDYLVKGLEQVKKFCWGKAAKECLIVYEKACYKN
ncbi:glycosyltransferase family 4 protein [Flavobacterium sp. GB2R13]|uniref:glycosyltransferase family 4 protein n=1 Tax=Flavobacterium algoris TaxID=3398733 RepID=UPI003A8A0D84